MSNRVFLSRTGMIVIAALLLVIVALAWFGFDVVPPRNLTRTRMESLKRRVIEFAHQTKRLPVNLGELPKRAEYDNSLLDGWGRPIEYAPNTNGVVKLRSLGKDNRLGGVGENEDVELTFRALE
jgi:hypothetical protein